MQHLVRILSIFILFCLLSFANLIAVQSKENLKPKLRKSGISRQNLINANYFQKNISALKKTQTFSPYTLKILGIRVEFQSDTLSTTTGDGTFNLSQLDTTIIDPSPHDREYFLAQVDAVSHYYQTVSNQKLILTGNVYPLENETSYVLPHTMDYYNPDTSEDELDKRLAELFQDAIQSANNQDQIPFSQYDIYVIFHAGVGQDFASNFETTPQDIPSAFLNSDHLVKYLGNDNPSYPGIQTSDGFIKEGIILPETENQEGSEFALKGIFVRYLGNQIGLPNLFNSEIGAPGIGAWGLMDVGSNNYFGLIPAEPCAWSKVFMDWESPILLDPKTNIKIAVNKAVSAHHIYKIPINAREYFLIENRNNDFNGIGIVTGRDQYNHVLNFSPLGNFTAEIDTTAGEKLGVITQVFDYDFNIPGSGILVWHIDDRVIEENYASNTINANPNHRGVDLEEADGSQDIGQNYEFLSPGSGSEFGVPDDAFFLENEVHQIANKTDFVSFTSISSPSSSSYFNANTGITLKNFSAIDTIMTFDFINNSILNNFPQQFAGDIQIKFPLTVGKISTNNDDVIFFTPGYNQIFAWNFNGSALIDNDYQLIIDSWNGKLDTLQTALFDTVNGNFTHSPILGDLNDDGTSEIISSVNNNRLIIWSPEKDDNTNFAQRVSQVLMPVDEMLIWGQNIIIAGDKHIRSIKWNSETEWDYVSSEEIISICLSKNLSGIFILGVLLQNGEILTIDQTGQLIRNLNLPVNESFSEATILSGFLHDSTNPSFIIGINDQIFALTNQLEIIGGFPIQFETSLKQQPIISDIDFDGFGEIITITQKKVYSYNHNGIISSGFPIELSTPFETGEFINGSPLALTQQNNSHIFIKDGANNILFVENDGTISKQNILNGGGNLNSPFMSLIDYNQDGLIELIDPNSDGFMNVRQMDFTNWQVESSWLQTNFNETNSKFNPNKLQISAPINQELLVYAFNYPNPTEGKQTTFRFFLQKNADVTIDIFDLAGEKISNLQSTGNENENEIVWNLEDVSSGIYLARIEASSENETAFKMIKVAVVQ